MALDTIDGVRRMARSLILSCSTLNHLHHRVGMCPRSGTLSALYQIPKGGSIALTSRLPTGIPQRMEAAPVSLRLVLSFLL